MATGKFIYKGDHRKFNYQPRYYNEAKERLDARKDDIVRELGLNSELKYQSKVGPGMFAPSRSKGKQKMTSVLSVRFFYIIVLLCLPIAWLFYGDAVLWIG